MSSLTSLNFPRKDKDEKIPYAVDWSQLIETAEVIDTAVITVTGANKLGESVSPDGKTTTVIIGGGTAGAIVKVHIHITTDTLVEHERTINLEIVDK
ncbi:hypothetical protein [Neptunomonas sp.]|uniref:phage fiber-tail adaptor protein n=1 Tax=Neptunomonas sp. TaxID=1971898 RepID=UPI003563FAF3